jgi:hypothetical protein
MQPEFRTGFAAMFQGYEQATGRRDEDVFSGWRSEADQAGIRRTARPGYAARGTSHHTLGDAADIHGDLDWFHAHAGEYGLQFPMWPPGKKSITEGWHVQGDPNTNVPVPHTEPEHQSMNMAPKMDDTDLDDGIKKMERLHHLAKTMPKIKLAHADDGIDRIHRNLNSRYMG